MIKTMNQYIAAVILVTAIHSFLKIYGYLPTGFIGSTIVQIIYVFIMIVLFIPIFRKDTV